MIHDKPVTVMREDENGVLVRAKLQVGSGLTGLVYTGPHFRNERAALDFIRAHGNSRHHYVLVPYYST